MPYSPAVRRRLLRWLGSIALAAALLAGCSAGAANRTGALSDSSASPASSASPVSPTSSATASGLLIGRVVASPVCPVERMPPASACAPRPLPGVVVAIEDPGGHEVGRVTAQADGTFAMHLPQGRYRLVPHPVKGFRATPSPHDVHVGPGTTGPITIMFDTGIR